KGFHRVRSFGLLHPEHRPTLRRLRLLLASRRSEAPPPPPVPSRSPRVCPHCRHAALSLLRRLSAIECMRFANPVAGAVLDRARAPPVPVCATMGAALT